MRRIFVFVILASLLLLKAYGQKTVQCLINTSEGEIKIELYPEKAPITVANFLKLVDQKRYDGATFYRACTPANEANRKIKIEVVQGGIENSSQAFDSIKLETTAVTTLRHQNGTLSMARSKSPNSATNHFFICIGDQPELDFNGKRNPDGLGFAAFGKVIEGMNIVTSIQKKEEKNQFLVKPVLIHSIRRIGS